MFASNIARIVSQVAWVVLTARVLGGEGYGTFSGVAGLALAFSGFVGGGMGMRLYRDVARDHALFSERWAQSVRALRWTAVITVVLYVTGGRYLFSDITLATLLLVGLSELVIAPVSMHVVFSLSAFGRVGEAAFVPVIVSVSRVAAVLVLAGVAENPSVEQYAILHCVCTALACLILWVRCVHVLKPIRTTPRFNKQTLREGGLLSLIWANQLALSSLDKAAVYRVAGGEVAGNFTVGARVANLVAMPVEAMVTAAMPRLFKAGTDRQRPPALFWVMLVSAAGYGIIAALAMRHLAWLVPYVFGEDFVAAAPVIEILAFYVPVNCVRMVLANTLLGLGWLKWRLIVEAGSILLMTLLVSAWASLDGAAGSALAVIAAELLLLVGFALRFLRGWYVDSKAAI